METGVQKEQSQIVCTSCGRRFRYKPELAGRTVKCPCGSAIMVPRPHAPAADGAPEADEGEYDFAPAPEPKRPAVVAKTIASDAAAVGLTAPAGAADAPLGTAAPLRAALPPQRKGLSPEQRQSNEELIPPSTLRDWILPSILIVVGIVLRMFEATSPAATAEPLAPAAAVGAVAMKLALSVGLMLGGMFLAVQIAEVCFVGSMPRIIYRLIAIAVAPGALYGIFSHMGGDTYGAMIGTFASVAAYGLLFWLLMRLDIKDTGMCVLMTWILVTAANYVAYKVEGLMRDSWV